MLFSFSFNYFFFICLSQMSQYIGIPNSSILYFDDLVTITVLHYEISKPLWNTNFLFIGLNFFISSYFPDFSLNRCCCEI